MPPHHTTSLGAARCIRVTPLVPLLPLYSSSWEKPRVLATSTRGRQQDPVIWQVRWYPAVPAREGYLLVLLSPRFVPAAVVGVVITVVAVIVAVVMVIVVVVLSTITLGTIAFVMLGLISATVVGAVIAVV